MLIDQDEHPQGRNFVPTVLVALDRQVVAVAPGRTGIHDEHGFGRQTTDQLGVEPGVGEDRRLKTVLSVNQVAVYVQPDGVSGVLPLPRSSCLGRMPRQLGGGPCGS